MRVLHLLPGAEQGGAETFATELILSLAKRDIDQVVVTRPFAQRTSRFDEHRVTWRACSYGRHLSSLLGRQRVRTLVRRYRPDVVQSWMGRAAQMVPRTRVPTVGWMGGYYSLKRYATCDHVVACTRDISERNIDAGLPPWRAHTINTFAMLDDRTGSRRVARSAFDTPEDATLLLALARLHPKKGVDTLLRALSLLPPGFHLWIAGEGRLRGPLQALTRELGLDGRVRFLGWREDRAELLAQADICVLPSRYEPFGTVIVEAWQTRTPIVACRATGPRDHIAHLEDGILCDIGDPADLARAIATCRARPDLARSMTEKGYRNYETTYNERVVAQRFSALYESLAKRGAPAYSVDFHLPDGNHARCLWAAYRQAVQEIDDSTICDAFFIHENLQPLLRGRRVTILSELEIEGRIGPFVGSQCYARSVERFYASI